MLRGSVRIILGAVLGGSLSIGTALAGDFEISAYGGWNDTVTSDVEIGSVTHAGVEWDGVSFENPIYWGVRGTYWMDTMPAWAFAVDFTHAKVKAASNPANVDRLEFTDGLNLLTLNAIHKWDDVVDGLDFYAGGGLGLSIPHVEVTTDGGHAHGAGSTFNFHIGGPVAQVLVGARAEIMDNVHLFGEYKLSHTWLDAPIHNGGRVKSDLLTHQALLGVSYTFENFGGL